MYYNGVQTDTSIVVIVRSTSNGTAVLTLSDGSTDEAAVNTATNYGHARIEITGLLPNTNYNYTVTVPDGTGGDGEITTFKSNGAECIAFYSCENTSGTPILLDILNTNAKTAISLGDEIYDEQTTFNSEADAADISIHHAWRVTMREKWEKMKIARKLGFGVINDDHDSFANNIFDDPADPPATLNAVFDHGYTFSDAAAWTAALAVIGESIYDFSLCNPIGSTVSSDTDPLYFSFEAGNMLVIVPSLVMWTKTEMRAHFDGSTPLMNANQLAWFKDQLSTTSKTFKVILSQKTTSVATNNNQDSWDDYSDLDTVLQWIHDESDNWAVPGGVIWGTGDWHSPGVGAFDGDTDAYDHVNVLACPSGRVSDIRDPGAWLSTTRDAIRTNDIDDNRFLNYGLVISTDDYVEIEIRTVLGRWASGRVAAGENKLSRPDVVVAI